MVASPSRLASVGLFRLRVQLLSVGPQGGREERISISSNRDSPKFLRAYESGGPSKKLTGHTQQLDNVDYVDYLFAAHAMRSADILSTMSRTANCVKVSEVFANPA